MSEMVLSFVTSFVISFAAIPSIIAISKKKHLFDEPNDRTSHSLAVPTLGGLAIFAGMLFSIIFWTPFKYFGDLQYILCAFILLFLIGAKDDIDPVSPLKKFIAQLFAAGILFFKANIRITTLYSIFGVGELPFWLSLLVTVFVIILLVNAFNLIDGINGLAASISILSSLVFGYWFYTVGRIELAVIAFAMMGSVAAFLRFNLNPAKIFMGDTGSLLIGLVAAILSIEFIEQNKLMTDSIDYIPAAPAMAIAVLIIPGFDTLRVMSLRILRGKSPFKPDKNHLHHQLLNLGLNHVQSTLTLVVVNIGFIVFAFSLRHMGNVKLSIFLLLISIALSALLDLAIRQKKKELRS